MKYQASQHELSQHCLCHILEMYTASLKFTKIAVVAFVLYCHFIHNRVTDEALEDEIPYLVFQRLIEGPHCTIENVICKRKKKTIKINDETIIMDLNIKFISGQQNINDGTPNFTDFT